MKRTFLSSIFLSSTIAAALLPAGSLWAAPSVGNSAQYLNQISEQTYQIQAQANHLEAYLRSGAHDWNSTASYTNDIADGAQKLLVLLDQAAALPGTTNDTRQQVQKMKSVATELLAFNGNTLRDLETRAIALHQGDVFANTGNIQDRCNMIRSAAQALFVAR